MRLTCLNYRIWDQRGDGILGPERSQIIISDGIAERWAAVQSLDVSCHFENHVA